MYADDVVLLSDTPTQLQRMLDAVSRYAEKWQFSYNVSKSAVVVAGAASTRRKREARVYQWRLSGAVLPVPDHYTYLGVEFGVLGPGEWSAVVTRLLGAARNRTAVGERQSVWAESTASGSAQCATGNRHTEPTRRQITGQLVHKHIVQSG